MYAKTQRQIGISQKVRICYFLCDWLGGSLPSFSENCGIAHVVLDDAMHLSPFIYFCFHFGGTDHAYLREIVGRLADFADVLENHLNFEVLVDFLVGLNRIRVHVFLI